MQNTRRQSKPYAFIQRKVTPRLEAMGAIREVDWRLRAHEASKAYREAAQVPNAKGQERSVLVVAATHDEIKSVTYAIREDRKQRGEIAEGDQLTRHSPLNWTEAQKKQTKNYRPGQVWNSINR